MASKKKDPQFLLDTKYRQQEAATLATFSLEADDTVD